MLGNGRLEAHCFDGVTRICHICGNMRKKIWINTADIILVSLRDFQDSKADVIGRYTADEARKLKARGELPDNLEVNKADVSNILLSMIIIYLYNYIYCIFL